MRYENPFENDATKYFRTGQPLDEERLAVALVIVMLVILLVISWCVCCMCMAGRCTRAIFCFPCYTIKKILSYLCCCCYCFWRKPPNDANAKRADLGEGAGACLYETYSETGKQFHCNRARVKDAEAGTYSPFCSAHRKLYAHEKLRANQCTKPSDATNNVYTQNFGFLTPKERAKYERSASAQIDRKRKAILQRAQQDKTPDTRGGYIYIFYSTFDGKPARNKSDCPGWWKIGFTTREPRDRIKEWPGAKLEKFWRIEEGRSARLAESLVHNRLVMRRYRRFNTVSDKLEVEWFYTTLAEASAAIDETVCRVNTRNFDFDTNPTAKATKQALPHVMFVETNKLMKRASKHTSIDELPDVPNVEPEHLTHTVAEKVG